MVVLLLFLLARLSPHQMSECPVALHTWHCTCLPTRSCKALAWVLRTTHCTSTQYRLLIAVQAIPVLSYTC